jgi:hypothetical protein
MPKDIQYFVVSFIFCVLAGIRLFYYSLDQIVTSLFLAACIFHCAGNIIDVINKNKTP